MDRLTEWHKGYAYGKEGRSIEKAIYGSLCRGEFEATAIVEKLAYYEDLEEQGKLVKLPCALSYPIYYIDDGEVYGTWFDYYMLYMWNEKYFLTREEAEAKLKEMESNERDRP